MWRQTTSGPFRTVLAAATAVWVAAGCTTDSAILRMSPEGAAARGDAGGAASGSSMSPSGGAFVPDGPAPAPREETVAFVCTHWEDDDGDGVMDYPDEFRGVGERFRTSDRVAICFQTRVTRPYRRTFRLWDGDRNVVLERTKDIGGSPVLKMTVLQYEAGQLNAGSYEAAWLVNDQAAGSARFEVVAE